MRRAVSRAVGVRRPVPCFAVVVRVPQHVRHQACPELLPRALRPVQLDQLPVVMPESLTGLRGDNIERRVNESHIIGCSSNNTGKEQPCANQPASLTSFSMRSLSAGSALCSSSRLGISTTSIVVMATALPVRELPSNNSNCMQ